MKIYKRISTILLLVAFISSFAKAAPEKMNAGSDMKVVQDSKLLRPELYNRTHRAGLLWMNLTNAGYYGNPDGLIDPCTGSVAPSGELHSGNVADFLFVGGLLFGGYLDSTQVEISGVESSIFQGPLVTSSYDGWVGDPMAKEMWAVDFVDDPSGLTLGKIRESSNIEGKKSCLFEEVYDPASTAEEQFNTMYTDRYVDQTYTGWDLNDNRNHIPLGIEVRQKSYAWSFDYAQKFIIIDYTLYNENADGNDIYDFFMGMYLDCDIGMINSTWDENAADDLGGFIQKWDGYKDPATNEYKTVDLNLAWAADNDGRNYTGEYYLGTDVEPGADSPLDGGTGIVTIRVLRNPNPDLKYAFNLYAADSDDEGKDWGPHWKTDLHDDWAYDLTPMQKGYDDTNHDGLFNDGGEFLYNGRTEGRPIGDRGKYMVMSNDEFDYNQYDIIDVHLGRFSDPDYVEDGSPFAQEDKWQPWILPADVQPGEVADGDLETRNDLANGADVKYVLSFGPLGTEDYQNVAYDSDNNGSIDSYMNKNIWRFAYKDSIKLTLAFIVSDGFHKSLEQDPNYYGQEGAMDPTTGIDPSYYDAGWDDALYNVLWAERVYDIPMYDTPVKSDVYPDGIGDGWFGEDVGEDGIYADTRNTTECWWTDPIVQYGAPDAGEGNMEMDDFTTPFTDTYGHLASNEDNLLPYGNEIFVNGANIDYEITGTSTGGYKDGYGYMVKYNNLIDPSSEVPQGDWVRYGFDNDKMDAGDGVPDFTGPPPPPSPQIEVSYNNSDIIVEWASVEFSESDGVEAISGPEMIKDPFTRIVDFEGYQVQVSPDDLSINFIEVLSVDEEDYTYVNVAEVGDYLCSPFSKERYDYLVSTDSTQIYQDGKIWILTAFGDNRDMTSSYAEEGMYEYSATPATKIINNTDTIDYFKYKFILKDKLYASQSYISVTSSDFGDPDSGTPALQSSPSVNQVSVIPTKFSGRDDVRVVPNPYRADVDYEELNWENYNTDDEWNEQQRKILFMNIPFESIVRIYTLAGDLVKTIGHNGNSRDGEKYQYGEYGAAWDLINENDQAVVSGIYLFSVQDVNDDSYEYIGKFVIIK